METRVTPIAVIGMACRLPGGIDSPDMLWEALLRGDDLVTEIPRRPVGRRRLLRPRARGARSLGVAVGWVRRRRRRFRPRVLRDRRAGGDRDRSAAPIVAGDLVGGGGAGRSGAGSLAGSSTGVFVGLSHDDYLVISSDAGVWRARTGSPALPTAWRPGGSPTRWGCRVRR